MARSRITKRQAKALNTPIKVPRKKKPVAKKKMSSRKVLLARLSRQLGDETRRPFKSGASLGQLDKNLRRIRAKKTGGPGNTRSVNRRRSKKRRE